MTHTAFFGARLRRLRRVACGRLALSSTECGRTLPQLGAGCQRNGEKFLGVSAFASASRMLPAQHSPHGARDERLRPGVAAHPRGAVLTFFAWARRPVAGKRYAARVFRASDWKSVAPALKADSGEQSRLARAIGA